MIESFRIADLADLAKWTQSVLIQFPDKRIFTLTGDLGAGKTASVIEFAKNLGSDDSISSPTFSLVNEYDSVHGKIYHFDLYRLNHPDEVLDIGFEEYLESGAYCFIEWPEKIAELLPQSSTLHINFAVQPDKSRLITIE
jgi:tRNA threonylcarbamoyladenosine biosynthesis protein TsaE